MKNHRWLPRTLFTLFMCVGLAYCLFGMWWAATTGACGGWRLLAGVASLLGAAVYGSGLYVAGELFSPSDSEAHS